MNEIAWKRKALKQVNKIERPYRIKIFDAVDGLVHLESCSNVKRLLNHRYAYRLRVGSYRVFLI